MFGTEGITRGLFRRLRDDMPDRLALMRERYGASLAALPDPASLHPDEIDVLSIEKFPALMVYLPNTSGRLDNRQTDQDAGFDEYSMRYNAQIYIYVSAADHASTSLLIKRYTLAVRECLLTKKLLIPDTGDGDTAAIDPRTIREDYSSISMSPSKKLIAASFVELQVVAHERLEAPDFDPSVPVLIFPDVGVTPPREPHPGTWPTPEPEPVETIPAGAGGPVTITPEIVLDERH